MINIRITNTHHLKKEYLTQYGKGTVFVETGTYKGDGIQQALDFGYERVYSCDINDQMISISKERFANNDKVTIVQMDSVDFLEMLYGDIVYPGGFNQNSPTTIWLDAHRSGPLPGGKNGDCPLVPELNMIAKSPCKTHTIFIDNKSLFGSEEWGYVSHKEVIDAIYRINPDYSIFELDGDRYKGDIICAWIQ